jgi:hypothetical protein
MEPCDVGEKTVEALFCMGMPRGIKIIFLKITM